MSRFRFKVNLLEVAIFTGVLVVFLNSAFQLFELESHQESKFTQLIQKFAGSEDQRELASQRFKAIEISNKDNCNEPTFKQKISADQVRLSGLLCGISELKEKLKEDEKGIEVKKFSLKNLTNSTTAEVFVENDQFKTETITLSPGIDNQITIEFIYSNGDRFQKKISLYNQVKN